jgi:hypothetical protein
MKANEANSQACNINKSKGLISLQVAECNFKIVAEHRDIDWMKKALILEQ